MSKFMVHDKHGNVWPPAFKSDLCSPDSPHSMLSPKAKSLGMALDAANQARAQGKGWGTGEIAHMQKPLIPKGAEVVKAVQPLNRNALHHHKWLCGGCGEPKLTTGGSKKINGVKVCAQCVAAGKATA